MNIKEGDMFKKSSDGVNFAVKKIVNNMAVLESQDKRRQILTEVSTLKLKSCYGPIRHPIFQYPSDETDEGG